MEITAAHMLESTYRLLEIEQPANANDQRGRIVAPSRHAVTIGQELRFEWARWYRTSAMVQVIENEPLIGNGQFRFSLRNVDSIWLTLIHELTQSDTKWVDPTVPADLPDAKEASRYDGMWYRAEASSSEVMKVKSLDDIIRICGERCAEFIESTGIRGILIVGPQSSCSLFIKFGETILRCADVQDIPDSQNVRSPSKALLVGKRVAIVGLGSIGSKVAVQLIRMGLEDVYLVDDDLLMESNLARHALDWQHVGAHKVDATTTALKWINPTVRVSRDGARISGQESNAFAGAVLSRLGECDIVVDATADPSVFNLLAAVAVASERPMVWVEAYGGGIGGMIGRSRPHVDPAPAHIREAYHAFCRENEIPEDLRLAPNYDAQLEDAVLSATDADVGVLASWTARLIEDTLRVPSESIFPQPLYLIGLRKAWVFTGPFDTIPIASGGDGRGWKKDDGSGLTTESLEFLAELIARSDDQPPLP